MSTQYSKSVLKCTVVFHSKSLYALYMIDPRHRSYFEGKKITVMGLGLLGRGVGDAKFLAECGAEVTVTDLKSAEQLRVSVEQLSAFANITFILGEHRLEDFENKDMILVAAGVPFDSPYLEHAKKQNVPLTMSAALFAQLSKVPMVGVTGTRGKSTVAAMIHHVLTSLTGEEIVLGGNIRGVSNLQLLKEVKEDSVVVFELDSWQLQGFGWAKISPQIAVFTNFMPDHLNYYKNDLNSYFKDKAQIFLYQDDHDVLVTTPEVLEKAKLFATKVDITLGQEVVLTDMSVLPEDFTLRIPGEHNRLNAALAFGALQALSLREEEILDSLSTFSGVSGRLEYMGEVDGVKIYNDNNSTTPQATIAGLEALGSDSPKVVLIAGGAYKDVDPSPLVFVLEKYCKKIILLPGSGTEHLLAALTSSSTDKVTVASLEEAVQKAREVSVQGDVLLFSPAFASFGMFANEYERNDAFVAIIEDILEHENV